MDAFDEVRAMNIGGVIDSSNECNNGNHEDMYNHHLQNDYTPSNNTSIHMSSLHTKENEYNASTAEENDFPPISQNIEQENESNVKSDDLGFNKEVNNSAEQPTLIEEPLNNGKIDDDNINQELEKKKDDIEEKMRNGEVEKILEESKKEPQKTEKKVEDLFEKVKEVKKAPLKVKISRKKPQNKKSVETPTQTPKRASRSSTAAQHAQEVAQQAAQKPKQKRSAGKTKSKSKQEKPIIPVSTPKQSEEIDEHQCRVCLVKEDLISIFKADGKLTIAEKLSSVCAGINIQRKDFLPQYICNTCMQSVQVAYNLKVLCETTDKDLRNKLARSSKSKVIRPTTEYVLLDATKFPSDESEIDAEDDDEFKIEEVVKSSVEESDSDGSIFGGRRRSSRRVRNRKSSQRKKPADEARPPIIAKLKIKPTILPKETKSPSPIPIPKTQKRNRKESTSPEKRVEIDFSSGSEDNYTPPPRKSRKDGRKDSEGAKPPPSNAPKEAQCPYCKEMFPSQSSLVKHKRTHSSAPLNCDMCGKTFKLLSAYQVHVEKHKADGESLKCEQCEKTFTKLSERKKHMIEVHNEKPEQHPCEKCKRVFTHKKNLQRHIEENKCPGPKQDKPVHGPKKKPDVEHLSLGRDLFKCVAPLTTTYWSDSFSD